MSQESGFNKGASWSSIRATMLARAAAMIVTVIGVAGSAAAAPVNLYWSFSGTPDFIRTISADGGVAQSGTPTTLVTLPFAPFTGNSSPWGVALDSVNSHVYWAEFDSFNRGVYRADLDGGNPVQVVASFNQVKGVAVHAPSDSLYHTRSLSGSTQIVRTNLDGSNTAVLPITGLNNADWITLNDDGTFLYWSDFGTDQIGRINLTTNVAEVIVNAGAVASSVGAAGAIPRGLVVDDANGRLYWVDATADRIFGVNLADFSGTPLTTADEVANLAALLGANVSPNALAFDGERLYFTNGSPLASRGIFSILPNGTGLTTIVLDNTGGSPIGLAVSAVPEPASMALVVLGGVGLIGARRRGRLRGMVSNS